MKTTAKLRNNIDKVLIVVGSVLFFSFTLYTKVNNISTDNTWAAYLGFVIFGVVLLGLWLLSNKIRERKKAVSTIIKIFIIFYCVAFAISFSIKIIEALTLDSGIVFAPIGTHLNRILTETSRKDLLNGFLIYSLVFTLLGVFLLYKSKKIKHKKGLSKFFKILSLYWIIMSALIIIGIVIEKILT